MRLLTRLEYQRFDQKVVSNSRIGLWLASAPTKALTELAVLTLWVLVTISVLACVIGASMTAHGVTGS